MRKISIVFALLAGLFASQAHADFTGKDAALATITFKNPSGACTSVVCVPVAAIVDSTGANVVTVITAGADATSNTYTGIATNAHLQGYNGTTWDRLQVDASKNLKILEANSAAILAGVTGAIPAGTNAIGTVAISPTAASGGWTHFSSPHDNANAPISTTVVAVKSSAVAKFGGYFISNTNATVACLQVFDIATAGGVTLGTTRPDMVYCVPATSGANLELGNGVAMANGIQIAATTTASGSSALGAGLDVTIYFK